MLMFVFKALDEINVGVLFGVIEFMYYSRKLNFYEEKGLQIVEWSVCFGQI